MWACGIQDKLPFFHNTVIVDSDAMVNIRSLSEFRFPRMFLQKRKWN